jgi:hypothetical protein
VEQNRTARIGESTRVGLDIENPIFEDTPYQSVIVGRLRLERKYASLTAHVSSQPQSEKTKVGSNIDER